MATYFHGSSEIQGGGDGLQTLILMNPAYVGYGENQQPQPPSNNNFVFLNNSNASGNTLNLPHAPYSGVPLHGTPSASAASPQDNSTFHGFHPRVHYNLYNQQMDMGAAREVTRAQQGLSLSLSSQQPPGYGSLPSQPLVTAVSPPRGDDVRVSTGSPSSASGVSNGVNGVQSHVLLSSKYLKAAQEILDEVVNVGKGVKTGGGNGQNKSVGESSAAAGAAAASGDGQSGGEDGGGVKSGAELTTAERQEIQMKKAKLVNMLDEVEQRYRQYHHQMQIVISWFEQAAGIGSAKTYTALALQTISKQFRCLKDAILGQIRTANKNLGEEDNLVGGKIEGSKLKYVDTQIRQQRALQQLGMIQHNAWRPQRGLPERSVSVLRAWLFEHFLHPYPKDSDKIMLAKQTGLTRSQVSNWFINARVRLWKPMVEEMYTEEMKENERNGSDDNKITTKSEQNEDSTSKSTKSPVKKTAPAISTSPTESNMRNNNSGFNLIASSDIESITQGNQKKQRNSDMLMNMDSKPNEQMSMNFGNERGPSRDGFTLMGAPTNFIGGFGSYPIGDLGRYGSDQFQAPYSGNGVSLTLGLPHCENLSMTSAHQSFMPNQSLQIGEENDFNGMNNATNTHSNNVYENINIQNRKRFAAQLLPDFVA